MRTICLFLSLTLVAGAQNVNPKQIRPSTVNGQILMTVGGTTVWAAAGSITALTGDVTASGTGSVAATLATVNSGPGACGDATHVCAVTTNGKGLTTAQTATAISGITIGSTAFVPGATHTSVTGLTVNTVLLNGAGSSSLFLNQAGGYTTPPGTTPSGSTGAIQAAGGGGTLADSGCTGTSGVFSCSSQITATGTKFPIQSGTSSNTDLNGSLTLSTGSATYSFVSTSITTAPICVAVDATATNAVKVVTSVTTLTITGTGSDVVKYICTGLN